MIIDIDCGNSRIKWQLVQQHQVLERGLSADLDGLLQVLTNHTRIARARICSVRDEQFNLQLKNIMAGRGISSLWAQTAEFQAGVRNAYQEFWRLGADRWLVILGAYHRCHANCLVMDCGTAITADFISREGRHLGGAIAPGVGVLQQSLSTATSLPAVDLAAAAGQKKPATTTASALALGLGAQIQGFVDRQLELAQAAFGRHYQVFVTGGDAGLVAGLCPQVTVDQDLLFAGLQLLDMRGQQ